MKIKKSPLYLYRESRHNIIMELKIEKLVQMTETNSNEIQPRKIKKFLLYPTKGPTCIAIEKYDITKRDGRVIRSSSSSRPFAFCSESPEEVLEKSFPEYVITSFQDYGFAKEGDKTCWYPANVDNLTPLFGIGIYGHNPISKIRGAIVNRTIDEILEDKKLIKLKREEPVSRELIDYILHYIKMQNCDRDDQTGRDSEIISKVLNPYLKIEYSKENEVSPDYPTKGPTCLAVRRFSKRKCKFPTLELNMVACCSESPEEVLEKSFPEYNVIGFQGHIFGYKHMVQWEKINIPGIEIWGGNYFNKIKGVVINGTIDEILEDKRLAKLKRDKSVSPEEVKKTLESVPLHGFLWVASDEPDIRWEGNREIIYRVLNPYLEENTSKKLKGGDENGSKI